MAALLVLACLVAVAAAGLDPSRVRFIDMKNGNFLFRGNLPQTDNGTFAYDQLNATMAAVAQAQGVTLPPNYFLVDLSLLDPFEYKDAKVEIDFFKAHPDLGEYINWALVGDLRSPDRTPDDERHKMALSLSTWQLDNLPNKMEMITQMLSVRNESLPRVIYIHCEAGMDRTGELSGSYYLYALNWSFPVALNYDDHVEARNISIESQNAFQWYCYYLMYTTQSWQNCSLA